MASSNVPKFGNWENEDNVPYTVFFEKARKNKGGKMINPNDPQENPDMFPGTDPPPIQRSSDPQTKPRTRPDDPTGRGGFGPVHEQRGSRDDGDHRLPNKSPARGEYTVQRPGNESNYGGRGQRPARNARPSAGSEQSFERSPLHPHHQAKVVGSGNASPGWDGKSHDNSHGNHGRSRLRPATRGDESPEAGAAVPKFGQWDENDPSSAENFTDIFNKVREERNTGGGNVSVTPKHPSYNYRGPQANRSKKCCFL